MLDYSKLLVLDTETGGLDPDRHPLIEVAYGPLKGEVTELWNEDCDFDLCEERALEINRCLERAETFEGEVLSAQHLAERLLRDLAGKVIVAANPQFDVSFLKAHLVNHGALEEGQQPPWDYRLVDIKSIAAGWLSARGELISSPPWGQIRISEMLGIEGPGKDAHSAAADVEWSRRIVRKVLWT